MRRWDPGSTLVVRHVWRGAVRYAVPVTVVEDSPAVLDDSPGRIALFLRAGTRTKWTWIDWESGSLDGPRDHVWTGTDVLQLVPEEEAHSVWAMWEAGGGPFLCWYVNLQAPLRRVRDGLQTWDHSLDIVVAPDLRWRWKDEDHLVRVQELGWMSREEAERVRAEGERVIRGIDRRAPPFGEPWPEWRPDPGWPLPELPSNWSEVSLGGAPQRTSV